MQGIRKSPGNTYCGLALALMMSVANTSPASSAENSLAQVPLSMVSGVDPNLILLFDNSNSMNSDEIGSAALVESWPCINSWQSASCSTASGSTFMAYFNPEQPNAFGCELETDILMRSADYNALYYDPRQRYEPWSGYENADPSNTQVRLAEPRNDGTSWDVGSISIPRTNLYLANSSVRRWQGISSDTSAHSLSSCRALFQQTLTDLGMVINRSYTYAFQPITFYFPEHPGLSGSARYSRVIIGKNDDGALFVKILRNTGTAESATEETLSSPDELLRIYSAANITRPATIGGTPVAITSIADEVQNFANWYQYYRTRIGTMKGAVHRVINQLPGNIRVGVTFTDLYDSAASGSCTLTNYLDSTSCSSSSAPTKGGSALPVRPLSNSSAKETLLQAILSRPVNGGTSTRLAFNDVGAYFAHRYNASNPDNPWQNTLGTPDGTTPASCRRNYVLITTDGYYRDTTSDISSTVRSEAPGDADSRSGDPIYGPSSLSTPTEGACEGSGSSTVCYQYEPITPYKDPGPDTRNNTLADFAMKYWGTDLQPSGSTDCSDEFCNNLRATSTDPAFWQHLNTYAVGFGVGGLLTPNTATREAIINGTACTTTDGDTLSPCTWPDPLGPHADVRAKADDLWHATVNGRGQYLLASSAEALRTGLNQMMKEIVALGAGSGGSRTFSSFSFDSDTLVFSTSFDSTRWSGTLTAYELDSDGLLSSEAWEASTTMPLPSSRKIYTLLSTDTPANFSNSGLGTTEKTILSNAVFTRRDSESSTFISSSYLQALISDDGTVNTATLIDYLRGDASHETTDVSATGLRARVHAEVSGTARAPLGDIANSAPVYVKTSSFGYASLPGYLDYREQTLSRTPMLYVGSNDGFLHGFNAMTGNEVFAYAPRALLGEMDRLADSSFNGSHHFFVDGPLYIGDADLGSTDSPSWHTLLLGSAGAGTRAVFALDVSGITDEHFTSASNVVMWEFSSSNSTDLGYVYGKPQLIRLDDGRWAAVVANGYNSSGQKPVLFLLNAGDGSIIATFDVTDADSLIDPAASDDWPNGLSAPLPVDMNGDATTDYVYAGDLRGNLWRFDLRDAASLSETASASRIAHIFTANATSCPSHRYGGRCPITAQPAVGPAPNGLPGAMVYFGTGQYFETADTSTLLDPDDPDSSVKGDPQKSDPQAFYAIWDSGIVASGTATAATFDSSRLEAREFVTSVVSSGSIYSYLRTISSDTRSEITWPSSIPADGLPSDQKLGWYVTLPDTGERVVTSASYLQSSNMVLFATLIPSAATDPCADQNTGWLIALDALQGLPPDDYALDINGDGLFNDSDSITLEGISGGAIGVKVTGNPTTSGLTSDDSLVLAGESALCSGGSATCQPPTFRNPGESLRRASWRQLE